MRIMYRRLAACLFMTTVLAFMLAWDERWHLYEIASVPARTGAYAVMLLGGWAGGSMLLRGGGELRPLSEPTLTSWLLLFPGASMVAGIVEQQMGVHWAITDLNVFFRELVLYLAGTACALILRYRRDLTPGSPGT